MTAAEAHRIIQALADGNNPVSGGRLPDGTLYQHPDVIRALFTAAQSLERSVQRATTRSSGPPNTGKPWTDIEDKQLCDAYDARTPITTLAKLHQRSIGGIEARLARLGKLPPEQRTIYTPKSNATGNA